jgi:DNA-binding MarR family transcriptional regulator
MKKRLRTFFDQNSDPMGQRIAAALGKLSVALKHQAWQGAGSRGLSPTQGQILTLLSTSSELRPSDLAARLAVSLPTVSDSVRALVDKGLVAKVKDERDARASLLTLTSDGQREAGHAASWPDFLATAVEVMTVEEQEAFFSGLVKMIRTLQDRGQIPISSMCVTCTHFRPNEYPGELNPHHCALVDAPMGVRHLRLHCPEHVEADAETKRLSWERFLAAAAS